MCMLTLRGDDAGTHEVDLVADEDDGPAADVELVELRELVLGALEGRLVDHRVHHHVGGGLRDLLQFLRARHYVLL